MQVTINITDAQLRDLNSNLENFLDTLTDEQKLEIVKEYLSKELNNIVFSQDYFGKRLSTFGERIISGLQEQINAAIVSQTLDNPILKEELDKISSNVKNNLEETINKGIIDFVINEVFVNKDKCQNMIYNKMNRY